MSDASPSTQVTASNQQTRAKTRFIKLFSLERLNYEFLWEAVKGLGRGVGKWDVSQPASGAKIPATFAGVCVAVPKDAAARQLALSEVKALGLRTVRGDFSSHSDSEALAQLLEGLQKAEVDVLLHLVQPLREARQMPAADAVAAWQHFVVSSLRDYGDKIEAVEIGTTLNRAKWSGYQLAGFLAAWETAYPLVKAAGLPLVGPNVTDFEPQYNAGVLGMLKQRECLPDIHSNNMFAERAIEPEAVDRKILGESLKRLHGYDLLKKMRLVASIARRSGVRRNWSTCAFWTLPRIERILVASEAQMADYLTRYFVLCASAGSFERIYWGPLVSRREGLLDDGTGLPEDRSIRDVVAYYRELPGESQQWRRRPAFYAMRTFMQELAGTRYCARLSAQQGLELHEFRKGSQVCVIAWTQNGRLARLKDCFTAKSLTSMSRIADRDGQTLSEIPDFLTESPLYIWWCDEAEAKVSAGAHCLPQTVVVRAPQGKQYFDYSSPGWRGVVLAKSRKEADLLYRKFAPTAIEACAQITSLRHSRNAIWTVDDPRRPGGTVVVKKPRSIAWHKRVLDRNKPSKALRSWNGSCELMRRGVETAAVLAYFESTNPQRVLDNWFICEHVQGSHSVRSFFTQYAAGAEQVEGYSFSGFSAQLLDFVRDMHWRGVFFRDLAGGNVLVSLADPQKLEFSLIDTARARFSSKRFSLKQRVADLKRLVHKLAPEQQIYFMEAYLEKEGARFGWKYRFSFTLYAIKTRLKRHKRKLRKKLR